MLITVPAGKEAMLPFTSSIAFPSGYPYVGGRLGPLTWRPAGICLHIYMMEAVATSSMYVEGAMCCDSNCYLLSQVSSWVC